MYMIKEYAPYVIILLFFALMFMGFKGNSNGGNGNSKGGGGNNTPQQ